jgi:membrane fusion protein, copper/silver efflux system
VKTSKTEKNDKKLNKVKKPNKNEKEDKKLNKVKNILIKLKYLVEKFGSVFLLFLFTYVAIENLPGNPPPVLKSKLKHNHGKSLKKSNDSEIEKHEKAWTCSMHPQIKKPEKDRCPICGMDLIPVENVGGAGWQLKLSENAVKLASIQVTKVKKIILSKKLNVVGVVKYDERRIRKITSWIGGRIVKLWVNYKGRKIKKNERMLSIYSPMIYQTQLEYIKIYQNLKNEKNDLLGRFKKENLKIIKTKLRLSGFNSWLTKLIEKRGKPYENLYINSPVKGIVIKKYIHEGNYVKAGSQLFDVVDLSKMWVFIDIYERDLPFIKKDQIIEFSTESYPGILFRAEIEYIDNIINPQTRTLVVRATVNNENGLLKEGMFLKGLILQKHAEKHSKPVFIVPQSAVLYTGKRSVVYVQTEPGLFEGRQVTIGHQTGNNYIILKGLENGEKVVTNGNFKIDSSLQILAKPSMMNPSENNEKPGIHQWLNVKHYDVSKTFKKGLGDITLSFYKIHKGLSNDNLILAHKGIKEFLNKIKLLKTKNSRWKILRKNIIKPARQMLKGDLIKDARIQLFDLTKNLIIALKTFKVKISKGVYIHYCPMARDNKGGYWIQNNEEVENPYFGEKMYRCGEVVDSIKTGEGLNNEKD